MTTTFLENGNICSPKGFRASAANCGLKKSGKPDICILFSESPALVAAAFTTNKFSAAPVNYSKGIAAKGKTVRAVMINSGNANACTGAQGDKNARAMAEITAKQLKVKKNEVLVCSTGRIGVQLPMEKIKYGIKTTASSLSNTKGGDAANAIITTDLVKKECAASFKTDDGKTVTIASMTKGSGMIAPQMKTVPLHATMLSFITTDALIDKAFLHKTFDNCVRATFNKITVDGDMSTNDTVILLANGAAENTKISANSKRSKQFSETLMNIMKKMAQSVVLDGEGATKFVTVNVRNASSEQDAEKCARAIANSLLCKTAWFGGDPNWGRVVAAAGYSGAKFNPSKTSLHYNGIPVIVKGMDAGTPEEKLAKTVAQKEILILIDLNAGTKSCEIWTNDISYDYVKINADYRT
jgi:glutamate N-acetyltransferase/amino-acid N-acetyltransferase